MDHIGSIMSEFVEEEEEEVSATEFTPVEEDLVRLERGTIDNEEADEDSGVTVY